MSELEELYDSKLALYMTMRLGRLAIVFIFVMFHLALWMCALTLLWVFQISPTSIASACLRILDSNLIQAISLSGLSLVTVAVVYRKVARWAWMIVLHKWIKGYVKKHPTAK
ncbi:hypothetical protein ADT30_04405 [Xylella fastidiosa]|nr:hypothetical protein ADT30_04405 [Xylella fastidiosa]